MIWLLWKLLTLPVRVVFGTLGLTWRTIRLVGVGRLLAFASGVGVGLVMEPSTGDQLRARLGRTAPASPPASPTDLGAAVRDELARSPRTWHLPQPVVAVTGDRVVLTGEVGHEEARADLGRVAGTVGGVSAVDNRITVTPA